MLEIQGVSKTFNPGTSNEVHSLRGVNLELATGSWVIIIGTNGSGKSTLLNAVAGTFLVDEGNIRLEGRDVRKVTVRSSDSQRNYVLATGAAAADRLMLLNEIFSPGTEEVLRAAGLTQGMHVADIGCGAGITALWMARFVGSSGSVMSVDFSAEQLQIAERSARAAGLTNIRFREATAYETGLSQESFDLVFSRFLMCHLTEPLKALLEMRRILKTGGILVCEDHDDAGVFTEPPTNAYKRLAEISAAVNRANGLDSSIGLKLPRMVCEAGFQQIEVRVKQLPFLRGFAKRFWEITLREAKPAILATKATTPEELESLCSEMRAIARDESILTYVGSHHSSVGSKVKAESVATPCLRENDGPERNVPGRILSAPNGTGATAWSA